MEGPSRNIPLFLVMLRTIFAMETDVHRGSKGENIVTLIGIASPTLVTLAGRNVDVLIILIVVDGLLPVTCRPEHAWQKKITKNFAKPTPNVAVSIA